VDDNHGGGLETWIVLVDSLPLVVAESQAGTAVPVVVVTTLGHRADSEVLKISVTATDMGHNSFGSAEAA
jgi:hypothetical protein